MKTDSFQSVEHTHHDNAQQLESQSSYSPNQSSIASSNIGESSTNGSPSNKSNKSDLLCLQNDSAFDLNEDSYLLFKTDSSTFDYNESTNRSVLSIRDRRSFYDNYKWVEDEETNNTKQNNLNDPRENLSFKKNEEKIKQEEKTVDTQQIKKQVVFRSEKSINVANENLKAEDTGQATLNKQERDDFDDLIDLTHRVPRKHLKKESNSKNEEKPNEIQSKSSLPPLPYSFVRLDKTNKTSTNRFSSLNRNYERTTSTATTKLIIPLNNYNKNKENLVKSFEYEIDLKNNSSFVEENQNITNGKVQTTRIVYSPMNSNLVHKKAVVENSKEISNSSESKRTTNPSNENKKLTDVSKEWDKISKIFASLETLLNEVVENTTKTLERSTNDSNCSSNKKDFKSIATTIEPNNNNSASTTMANNYERNCLTLKHQLDTDLESLKHIEVCKFLKRVSLIKYEFKFITNGYDNINFMNDVMTLQDLIQMGIDYYDDLFRILKEIKLLPSLIKKIAQERIKFNSVQEWLDYLNLSEYYENFFMNDINTMKKVERLMEIDLITTLQIPFLGHRRRMIASIETYFYTEHQLEFIEDAFSTLKEKSESKTNNTENVEKEKEKLRKEQLEEDEHASKREQEEEKPTEQQIDTQVEEQTEEEIKKCKLAKDEIDEEAEDEKDDEYDEEEHYQSSSSSPDENQNENSYTGSSSSQQNNQMNPQTPIKSVKFLDEMKKKLNEYGENHRISTPKMMSLFRSSSMDERKHNNKDEVDLRKTKRVVPFVSKELNEHVKSLIRKNSSHTSKQTQLNPKPIWRNDPQNLIRGSAHFIVQYLGSSALTTSKSNKDPVKFTIDRLKKTTKSTPYSSPEIELAVSIHGVKLLHSKTKDLLWNHDIKHINNVCQDQDDLNYFAFSTQTDPNSYYYCHVFSCPDQELSTQIILTIGQAFDIAYELFCKNNLN